MRKPNKKGFTIVELVIVIAVVAILAAVLIPTFVNVVNKANVSNDTALVKNINLTLATEEIDGKPATMHEALEMAERGGFDVSKLTPRSSGDIVWDSATNRFALVDKDGNKVFSENDKNVPKNASVWKIVDSKESAESEGAYSVYLKDGVTADSLTVKTGIDVGNNTVSSLTYNGGDSAKEVIIRTNGATNISVNAELDTVYHYGKAEKVTIVAVAPNSYHEHGEIVGNIEIAKGRVEIAESASVAAVIVTGDGVKVDVISNPEVKVNVKDGIEAEVSGANKTTVKIVNNFEELKSTIYNYGGYIVLGDDIVSEKIQMTESLLKGSHEVIINLNGHTCTYKTYSQTNSNPLFGIKSGVSFKIEGNGTVCVPENKAARLFDVFAGGKLEIDGGEFLSLGNGPSTPIVKSGNDYDNGLGGEIIINNGKFFANDVCFALYKGSSLTIQNGEFTTKDNFIIGTNGNKGNGNNKITINGGTFNASIESENYIACGIYLANDDILTVNGGTFIINNGVGILVRSGKASIGKDVLIDLRNSETQGKIGDADIILEPSGIVLDLKASYPGGTPTIVKNDSRYTVKEVK